MFICWWCLSFMNELQYCVLLDLVEYIMHLCLLLFMIQLLLCSWVYSLSFPKVYNQENTSETLNLVCFIEFYLRLCWLVSLALETISGTNNTFWNVVPQNSSKAQSQTSEKGSNANLVKVQKNNLIVTSLQASTKNGFEKKNYKNR